VVSSAAAGSRSDQRTHIGDGTVKKLLTQLVRDEQGQDLIEYGLLIGIITVGAIAAIILIGPKVATYFSTLETQLP
jgi:pilus assembly protein Flp/PilA